MAEQEVQHEQVDVDDDDDVDKNYKAPAKATLDEIKNKDKEDESLEQYKRQLLGTAASGDIKPKYPENKNNVIVEKLIFCSEGRDEIEIDLITDLKEAEKKVIKVKEGSKYHLKIMFVVQSQIVSGLRYLQVVKRKGIKVNKEKFMVGSYGPKEESHVFTSSEQDVPSGMLSRGTYKVHNKFTDDDENSILEWDFTMEIQKDW